MSPRTHRSTFLLLATALAATALLATGLPRLRLSPGLPLPRVDDNGVLLDAPGQLSPAPVRAGRAMLWMLALGAGLLVAYLLWRGLRGVRLGALLPLVLRGALLVVTVCLVVAGLVFLAPPGYLPAAAPAPPPPVPAPRSPLGQPPWLVLWLTAAGLALASVAVAAWLLRPRPPPRDPLVLVGLEAERARSELLGGADARSVILACYARMSAVLAEEQGVERPRAMTAREFGELLGSLGVPARPVLELTRLFEGARYGEARPGTDEAARALACLGPIVEHCRAPRSAA